MKPELEESKSTENEAAEAVVSNETKQSENIIATQVSGAGEVSVASFFEDEEESLIPNDVSSRLVFSLRKRLRFISTIIESKFHKLVKFSLASQF